MKNIKLAWFLSYIFIVKTKGKSDQADKNIIFSD